METVNEFKTVELNNSCTVVKSVVYVSNLLMKMFAPEESSVLQRSKIAM